jgi:hypothetical protein
MSVTKRGPLRYNRNDELKLWATPMPSPRWPPDIRACYVSDTYISICNLIFQIGFVLPTSENAEIRGKARETD